ncbi:MAG: hypothetical protein ABIH21_01320 [Patescibacteria group bacterium]
MGKSKQNPHLGAVVQAQAELVHELMNQVTGQCDPTLAGRIKDAYELLRGRQPRRPEGLVASCVLPGVASLPSVAIHPNGTIAYLCVTGNNGPNYVCCGLSEKGRGNIIDSDVGNNLAQIFFPAGSNKPAVFSPRQGASLLDDRFDRLTWTWQIRPNPGCNRVFLYEAFGTRFCLELENMRDGNGESARPCYIQNLDGDETLCHKTILLDHKLQTNLISPHMAEDAIWAIESTMRPEYPHNGQQKRRLVTQGSHASIGDTYRSGWFTQIYSHTVTVRHQGKSFKFLAQVCENPELPIYDPNRHKFYMVTNEGATPVPIENKITHVFGGDGRILVEHELGEPHKIISEICEDGARKDLAHMETDGRVDVVVSENSVGISYHQEPEQSDTFHQERVPLNRTFRFLLGKPEDEEGFHEVVLVYGFVTKSQTHNMRILSHPYNRAYEQQGNGIDLPNFAPADKPNRKFMRVFHDGVGIELINMQNNTRHLFWTNGKVMSLIPFTGQFLTLTATEDCTATTVRFKDGILEVFRYKLDDPKYTIKS